MAAARRASKPMIIKKKLCVNINEPPQTTLIELLAVVVVVVCIAGHATAYRQLQAIKVTRQRRWMILQLP